METFIPKNSFTTFKIKGQLVKPDWLRKWLQSCIAMATKENMQSQRGALYAITHRMQFIANRFPVINSLIVRINVRKRRDTLILGGVIAICLILLIWYI